METSISVIRTLLRSWGEHCTLVALAMLQAALTGASAVSSWAASTLERWAHWARGRQAALSVSRARRAREADRWRAAFEVAPLAMAKVSPEGRVEAANSAFGALVGDAGRGVVGRRLSAFVYPEDLPVLAGAGNPGRAPRGMAKAEVRMVCAGGQLRWCELGSSLLRGQGGRAEHVLVSVVDITRHKRSQAALSELATRDPLSGLANRRWFELQLAEHARLCAEEGPRGALLLIDLDNFKQVNDTLGHQAGDRVLVDVGVILRRHLRDQDLLARLGGDEFAVILREGDPRAAEAVARKLVLAVRDEVSVTVGRPVDAAGRACEGVTVSVGVAPFEVVGAEGGAPEAGGPRAGEPRAGRDGGVVVDLDGREMTRPAPSRPAAASAAEPSRPRPLGARQASRPVTRSGRAALGNAAMRSADAAMYQVKRSGRNGYAVYGRADGPHHARRRPPARVDLSAHQQARSVAAL